MEDVLGVNGSLDTFKTRQVRSPVLLLSVGHPGVDVARIRAGCSIGHALGNHIVDAIEEIVGGVGDRASQIDSVRLQPVQDITVGVRSRIHWVVAGGTGLEVEVNKPGQSIFLGCVQVVEELLNGRVGHETVLCERHGLGVERRRCVTKLQSEAKE